jgi:hypothetical protein
MVSGDAWSLNSISAESAELDVSRRGFTGLRRGPGKFVVAAGSHGEVARALRAARFDQAAVRLELDPGRTLIRPLPGSEHRVVQVRPRLRFHAADIARVYREIRRQNPDAVVVEGEAISRFDDLHWAAVIAEQFGTPTMVTFTRDQPGWPTPPLDLVEVEPKPYYLQTMMTHLGPGLSGLNLSGLDVLGLPGSATDVASPFESFGTLAGLPPGPAEGEPGPGQHRYVNSVVWRTAGHRVQPGEVLAADTDHRLGIGIGGPRKDSLLAGSDPFPDDVLATAVPRRSRRLDILVREAGHRWDQPQTGRLYLPVNGPAFTCPRSDQLPPDTDWAAIDHTDCQAEHGELAEFAIPGRSSPGVIELEVTLYLGAAAVHKHAVHLPVQEGPGATAKVTFSLVRVFDRLPVLIDRVASIDVGPDHLTVNAIGGAGTFSFRFTDTNWNPVAVAVRKELTDIHFRKVADRYQSRYPRVTVPAGDYAKLLLRLAVVGRQLYNQIFNTADSAGLAPLLRNEAQVRNEPAIVQIARTAQRPFAVPWQVLYDLPMEHPEEELARCPSVSEFGPGGGTWPPPPLCPHQDVHQQSDSALLCPWGFWGLAHILEVPEPPPGERSLDQVVSAAGTAPAVVVGTGSGLDRRALSRHLDQLGQQVAGFPVSTGVVTAAKALRTALEPTAMDIVYLLSHAEQAGVSGLTSALVFPDRKLISDEIAAWTRDHWPINHWDGRRPLIVLNACHTAEVVQSTLGGFVTNFVAGGAAGVIGTETLIDQGAASEAMEHFLAVFSGGASAGEAIRLMRWHLLSRGNLLGFTYTPYCAASLRLRPPVES